MSAWRKRAGRELPEVWGDEVARETPNLLFFELLPVVREAHRSGDRDVLLRAYAFAQWCFDQGDDLGNAAAVSFYEHLFDAWDIHHDVLEWLDPSILQECWPLFEARLGTEKLAVLSAACRSSAATTTPPSGGTGPERAVSGGAGRSTIDVDRG